MTSIELIEFAEEKGIIVEYAKLDNCGSCAVDLGDVKVVGIDDREMTEAEKRVHLAHEIGHCETGAFYNLYSPVDNRGKNEYKANAWAYKKLLTKEQFLSAFEKGLTELWQLSEEFSLTEDFIRRAYDYYFN